MRGPHQIRLAAPLPLPAAIARLIPNDIVSPARKDEIPGLGRSGGLRGDPVIIPLPIPVPITSPKPISGPIPLIVVPAPTARAPGLVRTTEARGEPSVLCPLVVRRRGIRLVNVLERVLVVERGDAGGEGEVSFIILEL